MSTELCSGQIGTNFKSALILGDKTANPCQECWLFGSLALLWMSQSLYFLFHSGRHLGFNVYLVHYTFQDMTTISPVKENFNRPPQKQKKIVTYVYRNYRNYKTTGTTENTETSGTTRTNGLQNYSNYRYYKNSSILVKECGSKIKHNQINTPCNYRTTDTTGTTRTTGTTFTTRTNGTTELQ